LFFEALPLTSLKLLDRDCSPPNRPAFVLPIGVGHTHFLPNSSQRLNHSPAIGASCARRRSNNVPLNTNTRPYLTRHSCKPNSFDAPRLWFRFVPGFKDGNEPFNSVFVTNVYRYLDPTVTSNNNYCTWSCTWTAHSAPRAGGSVRTQTRVLQSA